ncbi:MAG TPA: hypothetical protein PKI61_04095, partial [bacterium]|nr:hypothetical protein [bacterium]
MEQTSVVLISPYVVSHSADIGGLMDRLIHQSGYKQPKNIPHLPPNVVDWYFDNYLRDAEWLQSVGEEMKYQNRRQNQELYQAPAIELGRKLVASLKRELCAGYCFALLFVGEDVNDSLRCKIGARLDPLRYPPAIFRESLPWEKYFDFSQ